MIDMPDTENGSSADEGPAASSSHQPVPPPAAAPPGQYTDSWFFHCFKSAYVYVSFLWIFSYLIFSLLLCAGPRRQTARRPGDVFSDGEWAIIQALQSQPPVPPPSPNQLFFNSLLPLMDQLPQHRQDLLKIQIYQHVYKFVCGDSEQLDPE